MSTTFYVPNDTTACALGAEAVFERLQQALNARADTERVLRNGSRGLFWLEPLLEVQTGSERIAFGPVGESDIGSILDALDKTPQTHPLYLGAVESIPYLKNQQRVTFARAGSGEPLCLDTYQKLDGFKGLQRALDMSPQAIVNEIKASGLRGRGGAAFPAGIKWQTVLDAKADQKYIICNADEGDSGTFADRLLMEADPFQLIEGMVIAGLAVGASRGFIYLRSEYPKACQVLNQAISKAAEAGYLGNDVCGSGKQFTLQLRLGAGAYICGEETSLLESLEGKRGTVRAKPPLPALEGLFGKPTVVNNVLTLAAVSSVLEQGSATYAALGEGRSLGTLPVQLSGNIKKGGLVEVAFGITLRELVEIYGEGTLSGRPIKAIQVGGPLGAYLPESQWDTPLDYEQFASIGAVLGHGGVVVFDDSIDMAQQARYAMEFCAIESCGKCTPCRIGAVRGVEVIDRILSQEAQQDNVILLKNLCDTMEQGSLCAMGGMTPFPVRSALKYYPEDFELSGN